MRFPWEDQKRNKILLRQLLRGEMGAIAACFRESNLYGQIFLNVKLQESNLSATDTVQTPDLEYLIETW